VAFAAVLLLFSDYLASSNSPKSLQLAIEELTAICHRTSMHWIVVLSLSGYFFACLAIERRYVRRSPAGLNVWLVGMATGVLLRYACGYQTASKTTQVPILIAGITLGKIISIFVRERETAAEVKSRFVMLALLGSLFVGAFFLHNEIIQDFQYRGVRRWHGPWENPNLYGVLMGVGCIIWSGLAVLAVKEGPRRWDARGGRFWEYVCVCICVLAFCVCATGLLKSYSRGAWLGTALAVIYLCTQRKLRFLQYIRPNLRSYIVLFFSILVLSYWQFRFTEWRPARRIFSVTNLNDFSWRNRITV